jgi:hypothetical protein
MITYLNLFIGSLQTHIQTNTFCESFWQGWKIESLGGHNRLPNGILGVLTRLHYPGVVWVGEGDARREVLVTSLDHYALMPDVQDPTGRVFPNKVVWVVS